MDIKKIMELLPHRYPFLLVDKVLKKDENSITAQKNVTINEPFFMGHFPSEPIMPGVLQIEALAQAGGILCYDYLDGIDASNAEIFFMSIDNAKFRKPVVPGDVLTLKVELTKKKGNIFRLRGLVLVDGIIVTEAEFMAMVRKK
ncbi:MAG: 3-hydroxyacyl-ACP dehydratase FabZ [Calditerrivibrio sp.]|uniref:3-hydroxyacyl-ACP dehydratase FabZ n=1 Tax=Calditerrivibrio sp. TaxID=2792612 RepID=UPI003D0E6C0F